MPIFPHVFLALLLFGILYHCSLNYWHTRYYIYHLVTTRFRYNTVSTLCVQLLSRTALKRQKEINRIHIKSQMFSLCLASCFPKQKIETFCGSNVLTSKKPSNSMFLSIEEGKIAERVLFLQVDVSGNGT